MSVSVDGLHLDSYYKEKSKMYFEAHLAGHLSLRVRRAGRVLDYSPVQIVTLYEIVAIRIGCVA